MWRIREKKHESENFEVEKRNWKEQAPDEVKREERKMDMDMDMKKKMKQTFKMKREARTSSEEGEIECSLFEWLLDSSLWLSFPLFRFDCARAY